MGRPQFLSIIEQLRSIIMTLCCTSQILLAPAIDALTSQSGDLLIKESDDEIPDIPGESCDEASILSNEETSLTKVEEDKYSSPCSSYSSCSDSMRSCVELNEKLESPDDLTDGPEASEDLLDALDGERGSENLSSIVPAFSLQRIPPCDRTHGDYIVYTQKVETIHGKSVVLYFAVVCDERYTYLGWFYSLTSLSGYGYSFNSDGSYYKGSFVNGKKNFYGEFHYDNGSHYEGYWLDNLKNGKGQFFFNSNLYYSGLWKENRMISCELQYADRLRNDIQHVYSFITSHNDYIFFKQAQISWGWCCV